MKGRHSIAAPRLDELGDPLLDLTLEAGDCLYLPRGYPHAAETTDQPSDHLTIGLVAVTWQRVLRKAIDAEVAAGRLTDALPVGLLEPGAAAPTRDRARWPAPRGRIPRRCAIGWRVRSGAGSRRRDCGHWSRRRSDRVRWS